MNLSSAVILACLLLGTAAEQTKGETDWDKMVDMMTKNWKSAFRQFENLPETLNERGYPMDELETYAQQALEVAEKEFNEKMTKYEKYPNLQSDVKQIFEDYIPKFSEAGSKEDLVDKVVAAIRKYIQDPKEIVTCMGDVFSGSLTPFRNEFIRLANEKTGENTGEKFVYFQMGKCIDHIAGQIQRGYKEPCKTDEKAFIYQKCQPVCEKTFEKPKEA